MVDGDPATMWRRFAAAVIVVHTMEEATNLRILIDPRPLPARCRLFRRIVAALVVAAVAALVVAAVAALVVAAVAALVVAAVAVVIVAASDIKSFKRETKPGNKGSCLHYSFSLECRHGPHFLTEGPQGVLT
jgi:hypothetical protein